jgi:ankyrin repeat protein
MTIGQWCSEEPGKADAVGPDGAAPLHIAARHGHAGACEALCEVR